MKLTRAWIILIASVLALVVAYTLFGFFGVPRLLHSRATDFVATEYGRKLEIGDIQFNPFTLVLQVHGLSFPDTEGQAAGGLPRPAGRSQRVVAVPPGAEFREHRAAGAIHGRRRPQGRLAEPPGSRAAFLTAEEKAAKAADRAP